MKHKRTYGEISALCQELSLLLHSGVDAAGGISLLAQEEPAGAGRDLLEEMARQLDEGKSLSEVFAYKKQFPEYVCGLVTVGEQTGHLEQALGALGKYYEYCMRLDKSLRSALLYPAMLMMILAAVIVVLLTRVLPVFEEVYASLGGHLTGVAGGLLVLGRGLDKVMPVLSIVLALAVIILGTFTVSSQFRIWFTSLLRRYGGGRVVSNKLHTARFAQALAMGMDSGLTVEESVTLAEHLMEDVPRAKERCLACREKMEEGMPPARAMGETDLLPSAQCRLLELGVRSGCHDSVMSQIARRLAEEANDALEGRINRIEPALVAVMSALVGGILFSVMLPLMNIMTAIG